MDTQQNQESNIPVPTATTDAQSVPAVIPTANPVAVTSPQQQIKPPRESLANPQRHMPYSKTGGTEHGNPAGGLEE
jgi:hypothetical protein